MVLDPHRSRRPYRAPAAPAQQRAAMKLVATMRRYLAQIGAVLRPGSVSGADLALRSFAGFLTETAPSSTAAVTRAHIEDY